MNTVITALQLVMVLPLLYGLASLVKPFWLTKKRWHGGLLAFAAVVVFGGLNDIPVSRPSSVSEAEWNERVRICNEAHGTRTCPLEQAEMDAARASLAKDAAEAKAAALAKAAEAQVKAQASSPAAIKTAFHDTNEQLLAAVRPCDDALKAAAKTHGQYAGYDAAGRAKEACRKASFDIGHLHFGDPIPEKAQKDLNDALSCLDEAYGLRSVAMEDMMKVLDVGTTPSKVAAVRDTYRFAEETWQGCVQKYDMAKLAHGFTALAPVLRAVQKGRAQQEAH